MQSGSKDLSGAGVVVTQQAGYPDPQPGRVPGHGPVDQSADGVIAQPAREPAVRAVLVVVTCVGIDHGVVRVIDAGSGDGHPQLGGAADDVSDQVAGRLGHRYLGIVGVA